MGECNVKVVVRFRPFNEREKQESVDSDLSVDFPDASTVQVLQGGKLKNTFLLDRVLTPTVTQDEVFDVTARATVEDIVNGYNGTIFAFGQTGAGKSFSMFGPDITSPNRGIIPRACGFIFDYIRAQASAEMEITIKCSFLEIYREAVRDLLNPNSNNLKVRETPTRGVWVDDLTEQYVSNEKEVIDLLKLGEKFRSVSATQMNAVSSRSHSLFVLTLHQKGRDGSSRTGKLNLADLAGSEKVEKTGAKGDTLEEAKKINQSLSALGNCINALTKAKRGHIPYRDSKLTFLLRESLGGNSKTTLIVCCSAHKFNMEETISSLQFAQRAKSIKNTVKVNRQRSVEEMNRIINKLSKELELLKAYCQTLENEVLKLNPKFDIASIKKSAIPALQPSSAPSPSTAPSIGGFISNMFGSASGSPASSIRDDASDMSFDDAPEMNFGDRPLEELTLVELQVELEKSRETATLQIREHAEEIENLKDENETFRHNISTLEEENKSEKTAKTLLKNQLEAEQAKNGTRINKLEYENKQLLLEMEAIKAAQTNLESQNKALQDSLKKERDVREKRISRVMSTQEIPISSPLSSSGSLPQMSPRTQPTAVLQQVSPRKPLPAAQQPSSPQAQAQAAPALQLETKDIKETKPTVTKPTDTKPEETKPTEIKPTETKPTETKPTETKPTETKPTETKPTETKQTEAKDVKAIDNVPKQQENLIEETKPQTHEAATKLSLEDLLQQADPEADKETLQMLANDLGSLQLELNGAKSEISAMNKKLENKETRIEQLEAELQKKNDTEAELRKTLETAVQEADAKEVDFKSRIYYMEEAARVAKQRESAVRVVRPVEVKQQNIATGFLSSFFEPINKDIPAANSLTHCFKQGFLTKQGSRIKTWKKRFAILQGNTLFYYTPDPKREARGKFELDSLCVVQEADDFTSKSLSLGIFHPLKQPFFCTAESQQDRLEWIEALRAACTVVPMLD